MVPFYAFKQGVRQINLGLGKINVPVACKIQRELNKALHRSVNNKVDEYKAEKLVAALQSKISTKELDCIVCYEFNSVMVANKISQGNIPVAAMVHNSVEDQIGKLTALQRQEASKADVYQVLMPSYVAQAKTLLMTRIVYIPNVVPQIADRDVADLGVAKKQNSIVHIGRIEGIQKRQLILVRAFAALAKQYPNWRLDLYGPVGDENYKNEIIWFADEQGLSDRIQYKGITDTPLNALRKADIFAFPSAYEGFSLALTEAMGAGLPAIGFSGAASVGELIIHNKTGLLAKDETDFTNQLERLMRDRDLRTRLGANAHEAMKQYASNVVWQQWEDLLKELCESKKHELRKS